MPILMSRPDFYGVEYEINPWMHVDVDVDRPRAREQWEALYRSYGELGVQVDLVEPVRGLPDMVFTANAGVVRGRDVVLSRFRHPERQAEEPYWRRAFEERGFAVHDVPEPLAFEGAGDALFGGDGLFAGHAFRTDRESHSGVADALGVEGGRPHLVDPRF